MIQACKKEEAELFDYDRAFVIIGDVRQGYGIYSRHVKHIVDLYPVPEAAFCLGDIMLRPGNEVEWESFWHYSEPIKELMPLYLVRGNHEGNDPAHEEIFAEQSGLDGGVFYYNLITDDIGWIILDTEIKDEEGSIGPEQFAWLSDQLACLQQDTLIRHIFILMHRPLFSFGEDMGSGLENAEELHLLLTSYPKLRTVFAGHDHIYHRHIREGINYITTCGGGEPLYHGAGGNYYHFVLISFKHAVDSINVKTIDLFNEIIEDYDI